MKNYLKIIGVPTELAIQDPKKFKEWFIKKAEENFIRMSATDKQTRPMAYILSKSGETFFVFPDFENEKVKSISMQQIRLFASMSNCVAYGFVSEAYVVMTEVSDKEKLKFMKDLNYQVSLLPERKEVLLATLEIKEGKDIKAHRIIWNIIRDGGGIRLVFDSDLSNPDQMEGRMCNILE